MRRGTGVYVSLCRCTSPVGALGLVRGVDCGELAKAMWMGVG